jgi:hypothetical protein
MVQNNNLRDPNYDSNIDGDEDWENEVTKVEIRDNYDVIVKELKTMILSMLCFVINHS